MKKIISYMKGLEWLYFVIFLVLAYAQVFLSLKIPEYMSNITDLMQTNTNSMSALVPVAIKMLVCSLGSILCAVVSGFCLSYTSSTIIMRMREELFSKMMSFNLAEMKKFSTSSLITRCTNDMDQVNLFISVGVQALVQCPLTVILAVIKMKGNAQWMSAVLIIIVLITIITITLFTLSVKKTAMVQKLIDDINRLTKEHITGMRVVHAYNGYDYQQKQFSATNDMLMKTNVSANRYVGSISPFFNVSGNALTLIIYILGSSMILSMDSITLKQQTFSQMVVFSSYALQAFSAFGMILIVLTALPRLIISLRRIVEVIDTEVEITDGMAANGLNGKAGTIEFRNVSFRYPGVAENALTDISFTVKKGQTLAIIGSTGSGKTTLLNLIPRFYDATEGAVFVDGRNVIDYNLWSLRDMLGYVPQKSFLFAGTIGSNIDYGHKSGLENTLSEIKKAAEVGQSKEFVERKEGQYEARVEEGGSNFSGGQRQRLTISRAICRDPEFYLFDDSFSALDFKTDSILRKKLRENAKESTQVIVGQRIGSIMNADIILVLDKGRIVGQGKHEELLESCQVYREIAMSQLMSEEVK
jgi:ATP-binding cassette subfamily B protein